MLRRNPLPLHASLCAAALLAVGCNAIFGIQGGSPGGGGAPGIGGGTADAGPRPDGGDAGPMPDGGDAGYTCTTPVFPLTPVIDSFNGPNGALGSMWSTDTPGGFSIAGNELVANAGTPGTMVWSTVQGAMQEAYITVLSYGSGDGELELVLKNQGAITECDSILVDYQPSGSGPGKGMLGVYACAGASMGTYGSAAMTLAPGDQLGARACADGRVLVFRNGALVGTYDVSAFPYATAGGRVGFFASTIVSGAHLDDFGGGTVP